MITVIARLKIKPGNEAQAEEAAREMAAAVEANEPSALAYLMHRSQRDPSEITVFEAYADGEAFAHHGQTAHMGQFRSNFGPLFDPASVKIDRLERFAGFVR